MIISSAVYDRVIELINGKVSQAMADSEGLYLELGIDSDMEFNAFFSLLNQLMVRRVKKEVRKFHPGKMAEIIERVQNGEKIFQIALDAGFSSYKLAKLYTEMVFDSSFQLSRIVESPDIVEDEVLREDLLKCIGDDPVSSNRSENIKACVGNEFEEVLVTLLNEKKICFETEADLRARGKPKTPDIVLLIPMAAWIDGTWQEVNWIDSKGMFADHLTFEEQSEQLQGYVNRYGTGLVIYWYGFVETLKSAVGTEISITDKFPDRFLFPTGDEAIGELSSFEMLTPTAAGTDNFL